MNEMTKGLFDFIDNSPTAFQAVEQVKEILNKEGYTELEEGKVWNVHKGGKYYTTKEIARTSIP